MLIGIITLHFQNNYGAVLQTYALWRMCSQICKTEVIDYIHNKNVIQKENRIVKCVKRLRDYKKIKYKRIKAGKFSDFRTKYIGLSSTTYIGDDSIISNPPTYDIYLSGSDQIWNTDITNESSAYFLSFVNKGIKMSYASSFGHEEISNKEKQFAIKFLPSFKYLSVREMTNAQELSRLLNRKVYHVLDPVFLLDRNDWEQIIKNYKNRSPKQYILIYIMEDNNAIKKASFWAAQKNIELLYLFGSEKINRKQYPKGKVVYDAGPIDFLYLIANSDLVITNSFHGTAISMIFGRKLLVCEHTKRNVRITNLLKACSGENGLIFSDIDGDFQDKILDGDALYNRLDFSETKEVIDLICQQCESTVF